MKTFIIKWIGYIVLTIIYKTNKFEVVGLQHFKDAQKQSRPIMLCVWHGRMLYPIFYVAKNKIKTWAIASPHHDGYIMAQILKKWNVSIIEGSSNKNSKNVIEQIQEIFQNDKQAVIAITNDGPKGPRHIAKENSLKLAKEYNAQIITITGDSTKKWIFKTWDKFYLPNPFGKIIINIAPVYQYQDDNLVESVSSYMVKHEQEISERLC
jgi:lysophospholipid acyltransferase (LPLAT)-like uncharacterized protein